jgi:hypothetical protein
MIILLIIVIGLIIWSLRLMQQALHYRQFSLMLAGTLVAISAAGVVVVYLLMDGCLGYLTSTARQPLPLELSAEIIAQPWSRPIDAEVNFSMNTPIPKSISN